MYKIIPVVFLVFILQACNFLRFTRENTVFEDGVVSVHLIKGKEYFDGMVLFMNINGEIFKGIDGHEPFYKKINHDFLFFTYASERSLKIRPLTLHIYNPQNKKHIVSGPYELVYFFDPKNDMVTEKNNVITIYPKKGEYKTLIFNLENNTFTYEHR